MKNQYVGDINDFAKFGLLKALVGPATAEPLRLGVVWYLTPDDGGNDGRRTTYLQDTQPNDYTAADQVLYQQLTHIVFNLGRSVDYVQTQDVLPARTAFFGETLTSAGRADWFKRALQATAGCALVFLDPDNGLAPGRAGVQHASWDEVREFVGRGQSLVFIQFFGRRESHPQQMVNPLLELMKEVPAAARPFAMLWSSVVQSRVVRLAFYIVPATARHADLLQERARGLAGAGWRNLFSDPFCTPDV
jgi:hypothetical protein